MKISMDIIAHDLGENVVCSNIKANSECDIDTYEFFDGDEEFKSNCVYIFSEDELDENADRLKNVNVICYKQPKKDISEINGASIIVVDGENIKKIINKLVAIFKRYSVLSGELENMVSKEAPFKMIINKAAELVGMPLCMLDMNHNVLAISDLSAPNDALWMAMEKGYGYKFSEIVEKSEPKLDELAKTTRTVERINNISGYYIKVTVIFKGPEPIGSLGMHKIEEPQKPFEKHSVQLYDYIVSIFTKRICSSGDIKTGRGKMFEQFLTDIINGKLNDSGEIKRQIKKLKLEIEPRCQIILISFKDTVAKTNYHFAMMDYIEIMFPKTKCVMYENYIIAVCGVEEDAIGDEAQQKKFAAFLNTHGCYGVFSGVFDGLEELPIVIFQVSEILDLLQEEIAKGRNIFHYSEYVELHAIKNLAGLAPVSTLCHPVLQKIKCYDAKNDTDYFDTLKVYIRNGCNFAEAAKQLHMHKNSVMYRIKRIEEILGKSITGGELIEKIMFSLTCLEYIEKSKQMP